LFPVEEGEEPVEPQTLSNWHLAPEEKINEIYKIITNNIAHFILNTIKKHCKDI